MDVHEVIDDTTLNVTFMFVHYYLLTCKNENLVATQVLSTELNALSINTRVENFHEA